MSKLLFPSWRIRAGISLFAFAALICSFTLGWQGSVLVDVIYTLSAYSLTVWVVALPGIIRQWRSRIFACTVMKSKVVGMFRHDLAFRGQVSIYQGFAVNACYVFLRFFMTIRYASVWFLSMAVYYLVLGGMRLYLIHCYHRRTKTSEVRCYRQIAWFLFLLNIPMGGMILLMIRTNASFVYPGNVIYLSAMYAFYAITIAAKNLVKFRKAGSPILLAAKVLNLVSAMMSVLGLQTAMISRFGQEQEVFRRTMNMITGTIVYVGVIALALMMLLKSRGKRENDGTVAEQVFQHGCTDGRSISEIAGEKRP
ncbi:MAG: hypothetical protein Q4B32_07110 [Clostridia bacterium]|nr:hypothetical protein [Clostridia bacterium]